MPLPPTGKILLLQQFLVTSKIMLNRLQTVDSSNLITVVIVKDMLAHKVSVLDSGRRGLGSRPVARFSVTTCQRVHTAVLFSFKMVVSKVFRIIQ